MKPQKTPKIILKHANAIKDLINAYHSMEAITLSKYLDQIIKRLQNTHTEANAGWDLLKFAIDCAQGNQSTVKNRRIQLAIRDYYHKVMRPQVITQLARVKEQVAKYKAYQNGIIKIIKEFDDKLICVDKLIHKNTELIIDLNNSLSSSYLVLITQIAQITERSIGYFERTREDFKNFEVKVLRHNKKIVDLKKQLKERISLMRKEKDFYQEIIFFNSISDVLADTPPFKEKNDEDVHEVCALEWLMQNQIIGMNLGQDLNQESNILIKTCITRVKENLVKFFSVCNREIEVETLVVQSEQLQKDREAIVNTLQEVDDDELKITERLKELQDSMKKMDPYVLPIEEVKDFVIKKSSVTFSGAFQFFPSVMDEQTKMIKNTSKQKNNNSSLLDESLRASAERDNDQYIEDPCFIM